MVSTHESLLTPSAIKLYGRIVPGLDVDVASARDELGGNRFLREQLDPPEGPRPALARIYGFSYFGRYVELSRPALFLVHGDGAPASPAAPAISRKDDSQGVLVVDPATKPIDNADLGRFATGPNSIDTSGQASKCCEFSSNIRVWEYDRGDFSLRLDIDSGPLERILLDAEEEGGEAPYFRGAHTRFRGAHTRMRGSGE